MDDAELPAVKQPVMTPLQRQAELDAKANSVMERIWEGIHDRRYHTRMMKPVAVYLGTEEYNHMRAWSKALQYVHTTAEGGDTIMGLKLHQVTKNNHFNVTWEPE